MLQLGNLNIIINYITDLFNDFWPIIVLAIGIPVAFYVIEQLIKSILDIEETPEHTEGTLYKCDLCGAITDEIFIDKTGLQLCPDCYFADGGFDDEDEQNIKITYEYEDTPYGRQIKGARKE